MASKKNISALIDKMGGKGPAKVRTVIYAHHEFDSFDFPQSLLLNRISVTICPLANDRTSAKREHIPLADDTGINVAQHMDLELRSVPPIGWWVIILC